MLIGLTGYAQHGKDTVANTLVEEFGYHRVGFADALKNLAYLVNPYIPHPIPTGDPLADQYKADMLFRLAALVDVRGWEWAKQNPEVRRVLQELGTSARTLIGTNVWVQAAESAMLDTKKPVVISDVRFPNEADFIARHSGELWRIVRINEDGTPYDNGIGTAHPSEAYVDSLPIKKLLVAWNVEQLQSVVHDIMRVPV